MGLHVHKERKFLFDDNWLLNRLKSMVYKSIMKDINLTNIPGITKAVQKVFSS